MSVVGAAASAENRNTREAALQLAVDDAEFAWVAIVERLSAGDVVVTQDIGLAAMVLGRDAAAISPRGRVYNKVTIDAELAVRHAEAEHRRAGGRTKGPAPFEEDDRERFADTLKSLLAGGER